MKTVALILFGFLTPFVLLSQRCSFAEYTQSQFDTEEDYREFINEFQNLNSGFSSHKVSGVVIKIPVVFHVVGDAAITYLTSGGFYKIDEQIQILNNDFRKISGTLGDGAGVDTEIEFCLTATDPDGFPTSGITLHPDPDGSPFPLWNPQNISHDQTLKGLEHWNPQMYLNIYITELSSGTYGYAQHVSRLSSTPQYDGVVIDKDCLGISNHPFANKGRTLTHEIGHWLGLDHTWGPYAYSDCFDDDGIFDTPICDGPNWSSFPGCVKPVQCPQENDAIASTAYRQIENYMDYSDDQCMNVFTQGQKDFLRNILYSIRFNIWQSTNSALSNCGISASDESGYSYGPSGLMPYHDQTGGYGMVINGQSAENRIPCINGDVILQPGGGPDIHWSFVLQLIKHDCDKLPAQTDYADCHQFLSISKCKCMYAAYYIELQEVDKNRIEIGSPTGHWYWQQVDYDSHIDTYNSNLAANPRTRISSVNLTENGFMSELPERLKAGSYYKITLGTIGEYSYIRMYRYFKYLPVDVLYQNQNSNSFEASIITIEDIDVVDFTKIKAEYRIDVKPSSTVFEGELGIGVQCNNSFSIPNPDVTLRRGLKKESINEFSTHHQQRQIEIFPNPTSGSFKIKLSSNSSLSDSEVRVYDTKMQLVHEDLNYVGDKEVSLPLVKPGIYLVIVNTQSDVNYVRLSIISQ